MKNLFLVLVFAAAVFAGCKKDDNVTDVVVTPSDVIVGTWVSSGSNVAPLLVALSKYTKLTATFNADGTYKIVTLDSAGTQGTATGTYVTAAGGASAPYDTIRTIIATQMTPTALTAEGIYQVTVGASSTTMKYEVVQTVPAISATKPTAAKGFGSTSNGAYGTINIQKYVKQ